jgi:hypothetical protein
MDDVLFATVLALAWFATVNAAASLTAAAIGWVLDRALTTVRPASAARVFLLVRLLPGVVSLFFTVALFLPAHWHLEPANADESAGYSLVLLAVVGAAVLLATAWRAWVAARTTGWIGRIWARRSRPRAIEAEGVPVYDLPDALPVVSLVGVWRPRLFVATQVLDALTADELDVSVAHELAHLRSRDNLKRVLVACSPDLLSVLGLNRRVEDRWRAALEFAADARAVGADDGRALSLVSALVKVARLTPPASRSRVPLLAGSHFYEGALLAARIDRLLRVETWQRQSFTIVPVWPVSLVSLTLLAALLPSHPVWLTVHTITEGLIRVLP